MGAMTFTHFERNPDLQQAFLEARDQAAYEHGHGGYSGTLAEKHEVTLVTDTPWVGPAAYALAERLIEEDDPRISDKWGPAGAIPVTENGTSIVGYVFFGWASS